MTGVFLSNAVGKSNLLPILNRDSGKTLAVVGKESVDNPSQVCYPFSNLMALVLRAVAWLSLAVMVLPVGAVFAQSSFTPQAGEYSPLGALPGDQVFPHCAIRPSGGFIVWQDNATDGDGWGLSAQSLNNSLSGMFGTYRVNQGAAGHQENPRVALLADGGAVFAWQGGTKGFQKVFARFLGADGVFTTGDIRVNTYVNEQQVNPAMTVLTDGTVVIVWGSFGQDGSLQGVYGQRLSLSGQKLGEEFRVNQATPYNQRTPSVAALADGNFVVTFVSESLRGVDALGLERFNVDILARLYDSSGQPLGDEFKINETQSICANPAVSGSALGGFTVAWSQVDAEVRTNSWDIWTRSFDGGGAALSSEARLNTFTFGDQFLPRIESLGTDHLVVWTSLGQDGGREGVFGRPVGARGEMAGAEFRLNTVTRSAQLHPALAGDGAGRFLVVWANYNSGSQYDLAAQRLTLTEVLPTLTAPTVTAISGSRLLISWAELAGYPVATYNLYVNGSSTPVALTNNFHVLTGLVVGSSHNFRLDYTLTDGRRGTLTSANAGTTWGEDGNLDGLPDDWQTRHWGSNPAAWPGTNVDSDNDGATNGQEFLAGTDPRDAASVLRLSMQNSPQGMRLYWNSRPGSIYQVQSSSDFTTWQNVGRARFSPGALDSISLNGASELSVFRVIRVR